MRYRKLRIAWSVGCGVVVLLLIALWAHTAHNQVKALAWVSTSHTVSFVAYRYWMEAQFARPDWKPTAHLHSNRVDHPGPLVSPLRHWQLGPFKYTGSTGVLICIPLWLPVVLSAFFGTLPWLLPISKLRQFSLRPLLIATTLVAVVLGLAVYAAGK